MNSKKEFVTAVRRNKLVFLSSAVIFVITSLLIIACFPIKCGLMLLGYFVYMMSSNTFIPLPTPQIVVYYGEMFNPFWVALVGGIASSIACIVDYMLLAYVFDYASCKYKKVAKLKTTEKYRNAIRLFNKIPFITLVVTGFTPIPFDPVKFLAIAARYNRFKYLLSVFVGKTPRYFLLAMVGERLVKIEKELHMNTILFGTVFLIIVIVLIKQISKKKGTEL